jgi:superfamily II DNA or RNA helicase
MKEPIGTKMRLVRTFQALSFKCGHDVMRLLEPELTMTTVKMFYGPELRQRKAIAEKMRADNVVSSFCPEREVKHHRLFDYSKGAFITSAGMYARVVRCLNAAGIETEYVDARQNMDGTPYVPPTVRYENLRSIPGLVLRYRQSELLATMFSLRTPGTFDVTTGFGKTFLTKLIKVVAPAARIALVITRSALVHRAYRELQESFGDNVCRVQACPPRIGATMMVVSAESFHYVDPMELDYVLFDEVHLAAADDVSKKLMGRITNAEFFGFSGTAHQRRDGRNLMVEYMFGPIVMSVDHTEGEAAGIVAPADVYFEVVPKSFAFPSELAGDVQRKSRVCYQINEHRNRVVAAETLKHLKELGDDCQVLVAVTRTEHAYRLARHLPGFAVVHGDMSEKTRVKLVVDKLIPADFTGIDKHGRNKALQDFEAGKLRRVIATSVWREGVDATDLRLIVRADGDSSNAIATQQWVGRAVRLKTGQVKTARVLDFLDIFHPWAEERSAGRRLMYEKRGFKVVKWPKQ